MGKIWVFLNGKKTVIGGFIVWLCATPHLPEIIGPEVIDILYYIGTGLLFGGGVHKVLKGLKK